jgi:hypothetical protein
MSALQLAEARRFGGAGGGVVRPTGVSLGRASAALRMRPGDLLRMVRRGPVRGWRDCWGWWVHADDVLALAASGKEQEIARRGIPLRVRGRRPVRATDRRRAQLVPPACRACGCTNERACPGGCWWLEPDLCSRCGPGSAAVAS